MFLALGFVLPFFTGQIPQIGNMLLPMHLPVLLCGLICGWQYGLVIGLCLPLVRSMIFGMPPIFPTGIAMTFELAAYGLIVGLVYQAARQKNTLSVYRALIIAMIGGRIIWGIVRVLLTGVGSQAFTWHLFLEGALLTAIPGIILQLILIPVLMAALTRQRTAPAGESTGCEGLTYGTDCFYHPAKDSQTAERPSPFGHRNRRQMRRRKDHTSPKSFSGAFLFGHSSGSLFPASTTANPGTLKTGRRKF